MNESKYLLIKTTITNNQYGEEEDSCETNLGIFDSEESARNFLEDYLKPNVTIDNHDIDAPVIQLRHTSYDDVYFRLERVDYIQSK